MRVRVSFSLLVLLALAVVGCSSGNTLPQTGATSVQPSSGAGSPLGKYIKHVVIIVQENRSFDNIFAGFPGAASQMYGYTSVVLPGQKSKKIPLQVGTFKGFDLPHGWAAAIHDWDNGKMDAFNVGDGVWANGVPAPSAAYMHLNKELVQPYWEMAQQYVLADHMFPTMFGGSFTAHLDLIASTATLRPGISEVDFPNAQPQNCYAPPNTTTVLLNEQRVESTPGPFPCFNEFSTMADSLDAANVSWKYYAPPTDDGGTIWSEFYAIKKIACPTMTGGVCSHGPDYPKIVEPETTVLYDAAKNQLPDVSWVIPDIQNSDHASNNSDTGPSWVASVVNAVGKSPAWSSTAIIVVWDDWGGWYDGVPPPQKDYRGFGIRVPCIIISPYVQPHVSHTVYEFGSILRFVEDAFDLKPLNSFHLGSEYTDLRATSIVDSFDFTKKPRAFVSIAAPRPATYFLSRPPSFEPPDNE